MDEIIRELYHDWSVADHLTEAEYTGFVKGTYPVLVDRAKSGRTVFYGELPVFNELKERFGDTAAILIGFIVGGCSEYE